MRSLSKMVAVLVVIGSTGGCAKKDAPARSDASGAGSAAAAQPLAEATRDGGALTGLDTCIVGNWRSAHVKLKTDQATAEGGANASLRILPSGQATLDLSPMAPIAGKATGVGFEFRYAGTATATLATPSRGTMESTSATYSGLRVTADVSVPGAGKIPSFHDKPVTELADMARSIVNAGKKDASAPVPTAAPPGIDSSPLFSNSRYSCNGDRLGFFGAAQGSEWSFERVTP